MGNYRRTWEAFKIITNQKEGMISGLDCRGSMHPGLPEVEWWVSGWQGDTELSTDTHHTYN